MLPFPSVWLPEKIDLFKVSLWLIAQGVNGFPVACPIEHCQLLLNLAGVLKCKK